MAIELIKRDRMLLGGGSIDLSEYATKEYVNDAIANIEIPEANVDLTDYATKDYVNSAIANVDIERANVFRGKTASFYGDSLTEVNWHYTKGYHQWINEILELVSYNNYGKSGYKITDVYNKVNSINDTADIIFVMVGVNDVQFNVPLGTFTELKSGTVYGNLDALCTKLREKYPVKLLVFITPHEQTNYPSSIGVSMYDVAKAIKEVCGKHKIVVYDNFINSEICEANLSYFTTDKCHWNDKAHEMVGKNLAKFVTNTFCYIYSDEITHTHKYTESVTTQPTCTTAGVKTFTCDCGDKYTQSIAATGHNYVNGVCSVCGATDSNYVPDEPSTDEFTFRIINNSVSSVDYENNTLTLNGLNQTFGGVMFDGAKEVALDAASNKFSAETGSFGWFIVSDGDVYHGIGGTSDKLAEQYDFDSTLSNPVKVNMTSNVTYPTAGTIAIKLEGNQANLYFDDVLAYSINGNGVGYLRSNFKATTLNNITII